MEFGKAQIEYKGLPKAFYILTIFFMIHVMR